MANTVQNIYTQIIENNNAFPELAQIMNTNTSGMSLLQTIYYIQAIQLSTQQQYWDAYKVDLETIKFTTPVKTAKWWQHKMLNYFQYSSNPDYGVLKAVEPYFYPKYDLIDNSLNIIKYCSVSSVPTNRQITLKVAKNSGSNTPAQLDTNEINSAISFVNEFNLGSLINVVSFPEDKLALNIEIHYNGQYVKSTVEENVKTAITNYLLELPFDGGIYNSQIEQAILAVEGVTDSYFVETKGKTASTPYVVYTRKYTTASGYASLDLPNSIFTMLTNS